MTNWSELIKEEEQKEYYQKLQEFLDSEYQSCTVYPARNDIFNALHSTPLCTVKAVILGQDPYHEHGQAHGLAFSVQEGTKLPPSLVNIYKEIESDTGCTMNYQHGCLLTWAQQGVLLLNTVLSVREHEANSHKGHGWETFTDACIRAVNEQDRPIVFLLWGNPARSKKSLLNNPNHLILEAAHPSPLSAYRGFFGCHHFSKCNQFLQEHYGTGIHWCNQ